MKDFTGLIGRDALIKQAVAEARKGKHVLLSGPTGVGKSAVLEATVRRIERRDEALRQLNPLVGDVEANPAAPVRHPERRQARRLTLVYLLDHQAKGQFVTLARRLLETGLLKPSTLDLPKHLDAVSPERLEWAKLRRHVNRQSIRDLSGAIIPAIYAHPGRVIIAVDDMTRLTPTQQAFWLAVFDHAQILTCATEKKQGLRKLWWRMKELEVKPLSAGETKEIVQTYIAKKGTLIESPELYISHVAQQALGNPQAIHDMLDDSAKERVLDKRQIRAMRHAAGIKYLDFTPVMLVAGALIIATRYLAIGLGDTALYIMAGMGAAVFLSLRFFLFRGAGRAA